MMDGDIAELENVIVLMWILFCLFGCLLACLFCLIVFECLIMFDVFRF